VANGKLSSLLSSTVPSALLVMAFTVSCPVDMAKLYVMILNMLDIGMYHQRFPGEQLPFDASKRTIVVLGSGWASTSFLKSVDTEQYNVVSLIKFFLLHMSCNVHHGFMALTIRHVGRCFSS
jgi:hypothetical protein